MTHPVNLTCATPSKTRWLVAICLLLLSALSGCAERAVLIEPGRPVRLAEDAAARVWTKDDSGQWVKSSNKIRLPAGWDLLPPPPTTRPAN